MNGTPILPSPAAQVVSQYAHKVGMDPRHLVSLGVQAVAGQIVRDGEIKMPHYLVHDCSTCPVAQMRNTEARNIICFPQVG